ncbi:MAG: hypothetical protein IJZ96_05470 [Lachnospiraceae bacterium]|nr:hypothetical protein [Lachnospiraceae bacterium]
MKKIILLFNCILVLFCMCIGCKKAEDVSYEVATSSQLTEESVIVDDIEIPTHLDMTIEGAYSRTIIDADIIVPDGYKNCTVIECIDIDFTDEDVQNFAQQIFDKDSYFVYMPYSEEEKGDLSGKLSELRLLATDEAEQFAFDNELSKLEEGYTQYQGDYDDFQDIKYYELYDTYYDRSIWKCDLLGTIDGQYYFLSFTKDKCNSYMKLNRFKQSTNFKMQDVGSQSLDVLVDGNVCTYDKEEAETIARDYVKQLGFESMDVVWTSDVRAEYWDEDYWASSATMLERQVDGYNFYFGRSYENYSLVYFSYRFNQELEYPTDMAPGNVPIFEEGSEYIRVYVDSRGISEVEVYNPLEFNQVLSDKPVMISYSDVENIIVENGKEHAQSNGGDLNIYEIRLGYDMVIDGDKNALVPVWYVFDDDSSHESNFSKTPYIRINALDGTVEYYLHSFY